MSANKSTDKANAERKAYKDYFDRSAANLLGKQIKNVFPKFDKKTFTQHATRKLADLEFSDRVQQFSDALSETLPASIPKALSILNKSLPKPLPDCEAVTDGWLQWPVGQFIADHGLPYFEESMQVMIELTQCFTSEFAVRPFVEQQPKETFARLLSLTTHKSPHVRRWCSEGVRSRLPWGIKLQGLVKDPSPIWPILETLKDDPELYVRRSVANNLNDIAKDHPNLVATRCKNWSKNASEERQWLIKHGLRSLVKDGHTGALAILGYRQPKNIKAMLTASPKKIGLNEKVQLSVTITSKAPRAQSLVIDYAVFFVRKGGKSSRKVFKWSSLKIAPNEKIHLEKKHPMKQTTVRALYPGLHRIELQINGEPQATTSFTLSSSA